MSVDESLTRTRSVVHLLMFVVWMVSIFGLVLASAILSQMTGIRSLILAFGISLASTPVGAVVTWYLSRLLKQEQLK